MALLRCPVQYSPEKACQKFLEFCLKVIECSGNNLHLSKNLSAGHDALLFAVSLHCLLLLDLVVLILLPPLEKHLLSDLRLGIYLGPLLLYHVLYVLPVCCFLVYQLL